MSWQKSELDKIAAADELLIAPYQEDGVTPRAPTRIWSVAVDGELYVRAYHGRQSHWYQSAMRERAGQINAAGMTLNVALDPVDGAINDRIDEAYRTKYRDSPYLAPMVEPGARAATMHISPR